MKAKKTIAIDDVEYEIVAVPLSYAPLNKKLHELLTTVPENSEAAKEAQKQLDEIVQEIFKVTVNKSVLPEHSNFVYTTVADLTAEVVKQAELFRDQPDTGDKAGS